MLKRSILTLSMLALTAGAGIASAADGDELLNSKCASCHDLKGPAPVTVQEANKRKAPPLFYAGVKYNAEWLESWLQKPTRIRPAGYNYFKHIKAGVNNKPDTIDTSTLKPHPALSASEAKAATEALMKLKSHLGKLEADKPDEGSISMMMGEMTFEKFAGCLACHEIEHNYGGASGPEMYTAAKRMKLNYIFSYTKDPQSWDPKTLMPNKLLGDPMINNLTHYLKALAEEGGEQ